MESTRMKEELGFSMPQPTPQKPLLGSTVLVVEDSRFASEALRLLCLRSGARIRRADCLHSARRHLHTYRPTVAIVDVNLPDGSGLELIEMLVAARQRPSVVLGTSGLDEGSVAERVRAAGADDFLPKPIENLAAFQRTILGHMPREVCPQGPWPVSCETVVPDSLAMKEDLAKAVRMLEDGKTPARFVGGFLRGVACSVHDSQLMRAAEALLVPSGSDDACVRIQALLQARLQQNGALSVDVAR